MGHIEKTRAVVSSALDDFRGIINEIVGRLQSTDRAVADLTQRIAALELKLQELTPGTQATRARVKPSATEPRE